MSEDRLLAHISTRFSYFQIQEIEKECGKHKRFKDRSEGIRYYYERGRQFEALLVIYNDPKKKIEFKSKLNALMKEKNIEQVLQTMDIPGIETLIFVAKNIKDQKVQQLFLDVKSG